VLQRDVLDQVERPRLVACDTMNFWISGQPDELRRTLSRVDVLLINDAEARQLSGEWNMVKAARAIRAMGPRVLVVKKGEHGVLMFTEGGIVRRARLPAGGGLRPHGRGRHLRGRVRGLPRGAGRRRSARTEDGAALRRAVIMGSTLASFCVEAFSLDRLLRLTRAEIDARFQLFKDLTHFEPL
jgi:hypothetical protein